jgi:hypothetical protein
MKTIVATGLCVALLCGSARAEVPVTDINQQVALAKIEALLTQIHAVLTQQYALAATDHAAASSKATK